MKNLLNKTILKNCKHYKVRKHNSATTYNFTFAELQIFKKKNTNRFGLPIAHYQITTPSQQKAQRVVKILDNIVISAALIGFCVLIYSYITY